MYDFWLVEIDVWNDVINISTDINDLIESYTLQYGFHSSFLLYTHTFKNLIELAYQFLIQVGVLIFNQ